MGKEKENRNGKTKGNAIALLPIGVFLVLYLGLGILFEYVMKIPMGFYNVPIVVAFLAAILVACLQNRAVNFEQKLEIMSGGVGDKNIITMLLIFLAAGSFVGVVGRKCRECGVLYALPDSGEICSGGIVCGGLFCLRGDGNIGRNDHTSGADRIGCFRCFRI